MCSLRSRAQSRSARCSMRSRRATPCCVERFAITKLSSAGHFCASSPAKKTSRTNRPTRHCRRRSHLARNRSSCWGRLRGAKPGICSDSELAFLAAAQFAALRQHAHAVHQVLQGNDADQLLLFHHWDNGQSLAGEFAKRSEEHTSELQSHSF